MSCGGSPVADQSTPPPMGGVFFGPEWRWRCEMAQLACIRRLSREIVASCGTLKVGKTA